MVISQYNLSEKRRHNPPPTGGELFFFFPSSYNLPRIPILKPHARDPLILLVNHQLEILERALQFVRETQTREAGADADDSHPSRVVDGIRGAFIVFSCWTIDVWAGDWVVITWRHDWI